VPAQRAIAVERRHHVGGAQPVALEEVADEARAGQLARDVVLQVRVQAAEARVELRCGADGQHGGIEQVQAERAGRGLEPVVGARRRVAAGEPQRDLVGDVEAAERVARIRVARRDALDRAHHAAVDEVEGNGGRALPAGLGERRFVVQ
jgi:hypothetical protein